VLVPDEGVDEHFLDGRTFGPTNRWGQPRSAFSIGTAYPETTARSCRSQKRYLSFIRMLLQGGWLDGVRILRPETVALMGQNQIDKIEAGVLRTTAPALSNDVDFFPGVSLKWGFGHMINMQAGPDGRSAASLTWGGLLNTYYWIDPKRRIAAVFMTQILPFADDRTLRIHRQFERGIYGAVKAG
jgi:methyl acetate hydrolase